jgi:fatty acid desaturase
MEKPNISKDNRILVERTRASREITQGIKTEISQLYVLSARKRMEEFLFFSILYGAGVFLVSLSNEIFPVTLIGILLMGVALNSMGIFIHEGLHGLLAKNPKINHLISFLIGLPIMISATAYYTTHVNHHYELGRKLDYGTYRQYTKKPLFIWTAYFLQLFFGSVLYVLFIPFLGFKSASTKPRVFILLEYSLIITVFIFFFVYIPNSIILLYWLYPLLVLNVLTNIRGLASHALGDVENIYLSSRTVKSSKLVSFLFLYENYHLEHHLFPRTPSYNLSAMHSLVWHRLPQAIYSESYLHFLFSFFKAAFKNELGPMGVVNPINMKELIE